MKARTRVLAALLALFAFTAAFAEQVWASTCAPAAAMAAASMPHADAGAATHPQHGCDQDMPMPGHGQERHSRAPGDCPLQAVAASGCVTFLFAAVGGAAPDFTVGPSPRVAPAAQSTPDLLLAFPRFHPPQA
ncbi:MAG TPA: hypothetical protein VJT67_05825 [Longimicrobiaceae bacterium]|nr:hypothetical protein [Longimicrobiaceae bacterium]